MVTKHVVEKFNGCLGGDDAGRFPPNAHRTFFNGTVQIGATRLPGSVFHAYGRWLPAECASIAGVCSANAGGCGDTGN